MKNSWFWIFCLIISLLMAFSPIQPAFALSWSGETRLTRAPGADIQPSIIQTSDGKIWVLYDEDIQTGTVIMYKTSSDYGISWSNAVNLTTYPSSNMDQDPSITQLSNGTILVVWTGNRTPPPEPNFVLSAVPPNLTIPQGGSNTSTITVTSVGGYSSPVNLTVKTILPPSLYIQTILDPRQVTPPPNGNANSTLRINVGMATVPLDYKINVQGYSASLNNTKSTVVNLTVTAASGASADTLISEGPESLSATPDQEQTNYEIYYKTSNDNGTSWSRDVKLTADTRHDLAPDVMQASNGTIWVVWSSERDGNSEIYYKTSNNGITWSNDTRLTISSSVDARPAITQTMDGRIWVVWNSNRDGNLEIYYRTYSSSWSLDTRLTTTASEIDDTSPTILQTSNQTIWLFWKSEGLTQPPYILYKQSFDNGANWSSNIQLTTGLYNDAYPSATQSRDTRVWVVWASLRDGNWEIYYKASLVHNIAVTSINPTPTRVYQTENVKITVTVRNFGDYNETFTLSCYANTTLIGSQAVALTNKTTKNIVFLWNTAGFGRGNYSIKAEASTVTGEVYTEDNILFHEFVRVKLLGDVDDNGIVNAYDLGALKVAFGSVPGKPNWNEEADMNGNNKVDIFDLHALGHNFGATG